MVVMPDNISLVINMWGTTQLYMLPVAKVGTDDTSRMIIPLTTMTATTQTLETVETILKKTEMPTKWMNIKKSVRMTFNSKGDMYISCVRGSICRVDLVDHAVTLFAGHASEFGYVDGHRDVARFNYPQGIAFDSLDRLVVCDTVNSAIRRIEQDGTVSTLAGGAGVSELQNLDIVDGVGTSARFGGPKEIVVDHYNQNIAYVSDEWYIRCVTSTGVVTTLAFKHAVDDINPFFDPFELVLDRNTHILYMIADGHVRALRLRDCEVRILYDNKNTTCNFQGLALVYDYGFGGNSSSSSSCALHLPLSESSSSSMLSTRNVHSTTTTTTKTLCHTSSCTSKVARNTHSQLFICDTLSGRILNICVPNRQTLFDKLVRISSPLQVFPFGILPLIIEFLIL